MEKQLRLPALILTKKKNSVNGGLLEFYWSGCMLVTRGPARAEALMPVRLTSVGAYHCIFSGDAINF